MKGFARTQNKFSKQQKNDQEFQRTPTFNEPFPIIKKDLKTKQNRDALNLHYYLGKQEVKQDKLANEFLQRQNSLPTEQSRPQTQKQPKITPKMIKTIYQPYKMIQPRSVKSNSSTQNLLFPKAPVNTFYSALNNQHKPRMKSEIVYTQPMEGRSPDKTAPILQDFSNNNSTNATNVTESLTTNANSSKYQSKTPYSTISKSRLTSLQLTDSREGEIISQIQETKSNQISVGKTNTLQFSFISNEEQPYSCVESRIKTEYNQVQSSGKQVNHQFQDPFKNEGSTKIGTIPYFLISLLDNFGASQRKNRTLIKLQGHIIKKLFNQ